ncbi:hypothetical protein KPP03845_200124 (plasmid) [Streptomyces xanthophaeus]|nr:hypothetical protein KPP03845_200124 [Streptomyces xanthophaeus]
MARTPYPRRTAPRTRRAPYAVGDLVTGTSYVEPEDRSHEQPEEIIGRIRSSGLRMGRRRRRAGVCVGTPRIRPRTASTCKGHTES